MSFTRVALLIICFFFTQNTTVATKILKTKQHHFVPYDLLDDAKSLLDDLNQVILGNILVAHDGLDELSFEILSDSVNVRLQSEIDIRQEYQTLDEELINIKQLALAAEADISSCLINEDKLSGLPDSYNSEVEKCIATVKEESDKTLNDTSYKVDIVFNDVHNLNFTLRRCGNDNDCISGVIDQIKAAADDLPLQIRVYVNDAEDEIKITKVKIQDCADTSLVAFILEGSEILEQITDCVNALIS